MNTQQASSAATSQASVGEQLAGVLPIGVPLTQATASYPPASAHTDEIPKCEWVSSYRHVVCRNRTEAYGFGNPNMPIQTSWNLRSSVFSSMSRMRGCSQRFVDAVARKKSVGNGRTCVSRNLVGQGTIEPLCYSICWWFRLSAYCFPCSSI